MSSQVPILIRSPVFSNWLVTIFMQVTGQQVPSRSRGFIFPYILWFRIFFVFSQVFLTEQLGFPSDLNHI